MLFKFGRLTKTCLAFLVLAGGIYYAGCPSEEQIQTLKETKQAALSAEKKVQEKKAEKAQLEVTLAGKKEELRKVQEEKKYVEEKIKAMKAKEE
ncbi:MAG: hypothetical protein ACE5QV_06005 [Fidelibacterota bacterium]